MQGMFLRNPRVKNDEQVSVRYADVSGGYFIENQHEQDRMRDIHVKERESEATSEEQMDEWEEDGTV